MSLAVDNDALQALAKSCAEYVAADAAEERERLAFRLRCDVCGLASRRRLGLVWTTMLAQEDGWRISVRWGDGGGITGTCGFCARGERVAMGGESPRAWWDSEGSG